MGLRGFSYGFDWLGVEDETEVLGLQGLGIGLRVWGCRVFGVSRLGSFWDFGFGL